MTKRAGGEFAGAWASLAAAAPKKRIVYAYGNYTTVELINDLSRCTDEVTCVKLEAEIARRNSVKKRS